jgi:histidinol dehydrogenase
MMMMAGVPAKVAGVERIVVVTPPDQNGKADSATIAAARMIGLDELYAVGGVQAVGALAFGTATIPRVDKIVGPGSGYVLAAKQILSTEVDTGLPAGPSEAIILADDSADPLTAVTDLLIEAEHGPDSSAYLVTTDESLAKKALELPELVSALPDQGAEAYRNQTADRLAENLARPSLSPALPRALADPHTNPHKTMEKIIRRRVPLGPFTPGTLANYSIGPNAILIGIPRTASALSVDDYTRMFRWSVRKIKTWHRDPHSHDMRLQPMLPHLSLG